jgi:hypothetical protein
MRRFRTGLGLILATAAIGWSSPARAGYGSEFAWGMGAIGANALYIPAKLVYATLGGVTGGLGYLLTLGNTDALHTVLGPAVGGTYILTPGMLQGDEPILFSGESPD